MNNKIAVSIPLIVLKLQKNAEINFEAFLGFDASIDNIVRVVNDIASVTRKTPAITCIVSSE